MTVVSLRSDASGGGGDDDDDDAGSSRDSEDTVPKRKLSRARKFCNWRICAGFNPDAEI